VEEEDGAILTIQGLERQCGGIPTISPLAGEGCPMDSAPGL